MSPESVRTVEDLRDAWRALRERQPRIRARNAAAELGVSEAQLVASRTGGGGTRRIRADLDALLPALAAVGPLMALTRNDLFVHEKVGVYGDVYVNPHVSSVVGEAIDLRIFPSRWVHGFAVETEGRRARRRSLQFFDGRGVAVHKIFLTDDSDVDAWEAVVRDLLHPDQDPTVEVEADPAEEGPDAEGETGGRREGSRPDDEVDVAALEAGWREMEDTHDFFGLLRDHDVDRTRALRLVSDELARPASRDGVRRVLETASDQAIDLMVFVRSPGTIQIHHGPVRRIVDTPPWLNVLDGEFDLHVLEEGIGSTWVVRKPVEAGWVTSVEAYDEGGDLCALFFGCRKEGEPEDPEWRALARGLP